MIKTFNLKVSSNCYSSFDNFLFKFSVFERLEQQVDFYFGRKKWLAESLDVEWERSSVVFSIQVRSRE